ncbi:MAG: ribonuclease P protein subunit [Methanoregula sp.]
MISSQNVLSHELIGLDILVSGAANPNHRGLSGCIIDETKNLLVIETSRGVKRIPKMHTTFQVMLPSREFVEIDGSVMVLAPEKRINLHEKKRIT